MSAPKTAARLDAVPQAAGSTQGGGGACPCGCLECGASFAARMPHADFCSDRCRRAFNNRRAVRGAELYDLFMALRFERERATELKVWRLLNRMASHFRAEDERLRAGRKSWRPPAAVLERRPWLRADVVLGPYRRRK